MSQDALVARLDALTGRLDALTVQLATAADDATKQRLHAQEAHFTVALLRLVSQP